MTEGMYIRTTYNDFCNRVSIRKIIEVDNDDNKFWIDEYIMDTYGDEQNKLSKEDVAKASKILGEVLEPGDFLDFHKIERIEGTTIYLTDGWFIDFEDIEDMVETICTKEDFGLVTYGISKEG